MRLGLLILLIAAPLMSQDEGVVVVKAGRIYTATGEVIAPGIIVIEKGKIIEVRAGTECPAGAQVIDASSQVIIPGLIDAFTSEAGDADADESIAPDVRAIDGYDLFAERRRTLAGGITTTCVTPGSSRLISGQGAVVKSAGTDREARVLRASFGLRVTLGDASKNPPGLFKPPLPPSADRPIPAITRQYPATRMGEFAALRAHFAAVKSGKLAQPKEAIAVSQEALDGRRLLLVSARTADDMIKAIRFADEVGVSVVFANADEAASVADLLAERKISVILDTGIAPGRRQDGDAMRPSGESQTNARTAADLHKAGVRVAFTSGEDRGMRDLLVRAAYAVRLGLPEHAALQAVTRTPAEILGVADRVGSIEKGKDADLVFLDSDPLSGAAVVQRVMIDGRIAFERRDGDVDSYRAVTPDASKGKRTIAIRGPRILTVSSGVITDGLILIEDAKITYVGRVRPIPAGARIIDAAGLTAAPGLIDLQSYVGLHVDQNELAARARTDRSGVPQSSIGPITDLVRLDDPEFVEIAASGVTSVMLAPEQSGPCSLLKLAGGPKGAVVLRAIAAIKMQVTGGTSAYKQLKEQVERAKKYHDEWEAFERAPKDQPKEPPKITSESAPPDPVSGSWKGTIEIELGGRKMTQNFTIELRLSGTEVIGSLTTETMGRSQSQDVKGTFDKDTIKFTIRQMGAEGSVTVKITTPDRAEGTMEMTLQGQRISGILAMTRTGPSTSAGAASTDKKGPRKDDALEAYRPLFRKEIPVIAVATGLPAVENAVKVIREEFGLELIVLAGAEADFSAQTLARANVGVALLPEFLRERAGAVSNTAEALASTGLPIALTSSAQSGTRHLPLAAVHAIRFGLDAHDALKSVTLNPARLARIDARIGSLERGRDADVVLYTGDPFVMTSRVRMVLIDGKIVHEAKP